MTSNNKKYSNKISPPIKTISFFNQNINISPDLKVQKKGQKNSYRDFHKNLLQGQTNEVETFTAHKNLALLAPLLNFLSL